MTGTARRALARILTEYAEGAKCRACRSARACYLVDLDGWCRRYLGVGLQPVRPLYRLPRNGSRP